MSSPFILGGASSVNLQATISAATAGTSPESEPCLPHHPITCAIGDIYFDEEGDFSCDHAKVSRGDRRTQAALIHSMACLIVELACQL